MMKNFQVFLECLTDLESKYILEGSITPSTYFEVAKAVTQGWNVKDDFLYAGPEVHAVVFKRHDNTVRFVLPFLGSLMNIAKSSIIDFGCGCGSSSLALSHVFKRVTGYEIDEPSVNGFNKRMEIFSKGNTQIISGSPEELYQKAKRDISKNDAILLIAVVEHLTEAEQKEYLSEFWKALKPGQFMVILETPNFLAANDSHTFGLPFAHTIPDEYFLNWLKTQKQDLRFRNVILENYKNNGVEAALLQRIRLGLAFKPLIL
jgi:2-polyprenyl-3-methyl-5-hydroxy-6-metoxy-1,4-benzoquinol methylase